MKSLIWKMAIAVGFLAATGLASTTFIYSKDASVGAEKTGVAVKAAKHSAKTKGGIIVKTALESPDMEEFSETVLSFIDGITVSFLQPFGDFTPGSSTNPAPFNSRTNPFDGILGTDPSRSKILAPFLGRSGAVSAAGTPRRSTAGSFGGPTPTSRQPGGSSSAGGTGGSSGGSGGGFSPNIGSDGLPQNEALMTALRAPVTTVPLPSSAPLLLVGFAALSLLRKRRVA